LRSGPLDGGRLSFALLLAPEATVLQ